MIRQFSSKLLLTFFIGLAFTFCSDPVKVGEDSNKVTLNDAWISNTVDEDEDGYASYARLYFEINSKNAANYVALVGYRYSSSEDPTYFVYKELLPFDVDGDRTLWVALGDDGYEIETGIYDLTIQIFAEEDAEYTEILTSISADDNENLSGIAMEEPADDQALQISLTDAWIANEIDDDEDGYSAEADIYFQISSTMAAQVFAVIKYKPTSSSIYNDYKQTSIFNVEGTSNFYVALGNLGYELAHNTYDFSIEIYLSTDTERLNLVSIISANTDTDIGNVGMEAPEEDVQIVQLIFNNECHTEIIADITGYGSISIPAKSTNTYYFNGNPDSITFNAATQIPVGGNLVWTDRGVNLSGLNEYTYRMWYSDAIFYATITNNGGSTRKDFFVNYGLIDQFYVDVSIPNDGVTRAFGYYNAHPETEIWSWSTGAETWYSWSELNYPGGDNQVINLTTSLPKTAVGFDPPLNKTNSEKKLFIEAP